MHLLTLFGLITAAFLCSASSNYGHTQTVQYLALDPDHNGLYDDSERKDLLDFFIKNSPEFINNVQKKSTAVAKASSNYQEDFEINNDSPQSQLANTVQFIGFDLNGDGKVSIREQSEGRPPLSLLLPESITQIDQRIPWAIDIFPEWLTTAFLQEDVKIGKVHQHDSRGVVPRSATQLDAMMQPMKTSSKSGVVFTADSGQHFSTEGRRDARWDYRWCIFTFRIDARSSTAENTLLLDVNSGQSGGMSSPKIWYNREHGLNIQYTGTNANGLDKRIMQTNEIATDGETWNVLVCGIRYGQMYASVNGTPLQTKNPQPPRYSTDWARDRKTHIGESKKENLEWAYDAIIFGLTEPTEAMVEKMTGWAAHRLGFADKLPKNHPYSQNRPFLDLEDFPYRYNHDDTAWNHWGTNLRNAAETRMNAGASPVKKQGYQRVFFDDFREKRVTDSISGEGDLWTGHGLNASVGVAAPLIRPSQSEQAYEHNADDQTLTLGIIPQGDNPQQWRGSAIYSINDLGYGHTWKGPKVFRIRCKFPKSSQENLSKGLFPAFWSYGIENIFWRTSNRIEIDYFEFDGINGHWLNALSTHYHYPYIRDEANIFAKNRDSYNRFKIYSGPLSEDKSNIPGGIFIWDGQFHTWEFVIDEEMTYINVTIQDSNGQEKWVEVARCPTAPTYLEEVILITNNALKAREGKGYPQTRERQDYIIDWIEVLQKTDQIESVPETFTKRPELQVSDGFHPGNTIFCQPNVKDASDIRYFWYADGYPLTYGPDHTYTLTANDIGKEIRCKVKVVGARNSPEAWSNSLK